MNTSPLTLLAIICSACLSAGASEPTTQPAGQQAAPPAQQTALHPPRTSPPEQQSLWLRLSIRSQNAGHRLHMLGVDSGEPDTKAFAEDIAAIDRLLNELVKQGQLTRKTYKLKPYLDLDESLLRAVGQFMDKAAAQYGRYVVREMLDVGTRKRLEDFNEDAPVVLNARVPANLLKELEAIFSKKK